jgi:hypothetical protein
MIVLLGLVINVGSIFPRNREDRGFHLADDRPLPIEAFKASEQFVHSCGDVRGKPRAIFSF